MRVPASASLFLVLILAKAMVVMRIGVPLTWASVIALLGPDALTALVFAVVEVVAGRRRAIWIPYAIAVGWVALNVAVALVLRTWLTRPMIAAASGPLADSIRYYLTPVTLLPAALVIGAGVAFPRLLLNRVSASRGTLAAAVVAAMAGVVSGPADARGFDRNAFTALLDGARLNAKAASAAEGSVTPDWRRSPFESGAPGIESLRRSAAGFNVVVVILESTAAEYLGIYGAAEDPMPNLTRLARRGVVFDAAYAVYPESVKGLYAALCSRAPRMNAALGDSLADPCTPLPRALGAVGYRTALFHAGRFAYLGMDSLVAQSGFDLAADAGAISGVVRSSFGVDEASTAARAIDWIASDDPRPFLAVYMPAAGHHPYASALPGPFSGATEFGRYRNALHETDVALGQIVDALDRLTVLDRTMFVVFGDHGEAFGQHDGQIGHTLAIWDENVRVPLVIAVPGHSSPRRIEAPASVLDITPTVLDLIGLPWPTSTEGASLLQPGARIAPFFADYSTRWLGLRDGCWKYQLDRDADRSLLFEMCVDPRERDDLSAHESARVAAYRDRLDAWRR